MLPNLPQALIAHYGVLKAGAIVVQTNPLYVAREIEAQLVDSGSETIVALDLFYPRIQAVKERTPLKRIIIDVCSGLSSPPEAAALSHQGSDERASRSYRTASVDLQLSPASEPGDDEWRRGIAPVVETR